MRFRAWLARPLLLYLERRIAMTNDQILTQVTTIAAGVATIGDGVVALKDAVAAAGGTSPEVDAALNALAASVANVVAILPAPTPAA
jgi:hypothetical protein